MARYRRPDTMAVFRFDAEKSLVAGLRILREAKAPHALAGRLAVWCYVPEEGQGLTKDVDFAVPYGHGRDLAAIAAGKGYRVQELTIGGWAARKPGIAIDFIDRHPALSRLFADAVRAARRQRRRVRVDKFFLPVVPRDYLIAMKIVVLEPKDDRDISELLKVTPTRRYAPLRSLISRYHGFIGVQRLDQLARAIGHRGPKSVMSRYRANGA